MRSIELFEIIGEAQDDYIRDAKTPYKKYAPVWVKWAAMASCLCLILAMVWFFRPAIPNHPDATYSAYDIADLFPMILDANATNIYTTIHVPDDEYLQLHALPETEYVSIYRNNESTALAPGQEKTKSFIAQNLTRFCNALAIPVPDYAFTDGNSYWNLTTPDDRYFFSSWSKHSWTSFYLSATFETDDPTIRLNGTSVQVDQHQTNQDILSSLEGVKSQLFDICGVSFSDAKVNRYYEGSSEHGVTYLVIYYYDETAHPLNATSERPVSDHIEIHFDNMKNSQVDFVSDTILSFASITYMDYTLPPEDIYPQIAKANTLSLAEAEALLYKGYVFGGHTCPLCTADQEQVSFKDYDHVSFEYVYGRDGGDVIPFYTFYKAIATSENGNIVYAKTFVPAIEVSDLDAYFEKAMERSSCPYA